MTSLPHMTPPTHGHRSAMHSNDRLYIGKQPRTNAVPQTTSFEALRPGEKKQSEMTTTEKWRYHRSRFLELLPGRLGALEERFQLLVKLSNRESYEFSEEEAKFLVRRLRGWVDAVEKSFKGRKPFYPVDLSPVALDMDMAPPADLYDFRRCAILKTSGD